MVVVADGLTVAPPGYLVNIPGIARYTRGNVMRLVADGYLLADGSLEHCMYESNTMTMADRDKCTDITINHDDDTVALILRLNGVEQFAHINDAV